MVQHQVIAIGVCEERDVADAGVKDVAQATRSGAVRIADRAQRSVGVLVLAVGERDVGPGLGHAVEQK
jgi:hypothetical protein